MDKMRKATGLSRRAAYLRGKLLEKRRLLLENMLSGFEASAESSEGAPADLADLRVHRRVLVVPALRKRSDLLGRPLPRRS